MSNPPPNREKTLGGVQRTKFAPNLAARRNKKDAGGPHALHKLLAEDRNTEAPAAVAPADRYGERPGEGKGAGKGKGKGRAGGRGGGRGGSSWDGGESSAAGGGQANDDMDVDAGGVKLEEGGADAARPAARHAPVTRAWLQLPNAPLALPLRPTPIGRLAANGGISGRTTPASRPASRLGSGVHVFPPDSTAAALLQNDEELLMGAGEEKLLFVQLPSALPLRPSTAALNGPGAPQPAGASAATRAKAAATIAAANAAIRAKPVTGTEYMGALSRGVEGGGGGGYGGTGGAGTAAASGPVGVVSEVTGGSAGGFGMGGGSFTGGGAAPGASPLATLEELDEGPEGELLVYRSGKVSHPFTIDGYTFFIFTCAAGIFELRCRLLHLSVLLTAPLACCCGGSLSSPRPLPAAVRCGSTGGLPCAVIRPLFAQPAHRATYRRQFRGLETRSYTAIEPESSSARSVHHTPRLLTVCTLYI